MGKRVEKHCSILNYLQQVDTALYDVIKNLCITRMLLPNMRKFSGVTFLRPDKKLLAEIQEMAFGDDPEEAVFALQSLALLDHLPTPGDFGEKKDSIATFLRKKLPVKSVSGDKVILANGAEIVLDPNFHTRRTRNNMSVYIISNKLVPTDTEPADLSQIKDNNRKIKGGAEFNNQRSVLFNAVLKTHCCGDETAKFNPAMEVLVSLCEYLKTNETPDNNLVYKVVTSQMSWDTLASLAIVLQPFRSTDTLTYISPALYTAWAAKSRDLNKLLTNVYYLSADTVDRYSKHMAAAGDSPMNDLEKLRGKALEVSAKPRVLSLISGIYKEMAKSSGLPDARKRTLENVSLALAESELRVFSALLHENSRKSVDVTEATSLYVNKCNLTKPYIVSLKGHVNMSNIGFYFSSVYLMLRACGLIYWPGQGSSNGLDQIANESALIRLDLMLEGIVSALAPNYSERHGALMKRLGT